MEGFVKKTGTVELPVGYFDANTSNQFIDYGTQNFPLHLEHLTSWVCFLSLCVMGIRQKDSCLLSQVGSKCQHLRVCMTFNRAYHSKIYASETLYSLQVT